MNVRRRNINTSRLTEFGRNLSAERHRLGLSQDDLGDLIDKEGRYIGRIERGEVNPTLTTIILICEALNLPFDSFIKLNLK